MQARSRGLQRCMAAGVACRRAVRGQLRSRRLPAASRSSVGMPRAPATTSPRSANSPDSTQHDAVRHCRAPGRARRRRNGSSARRRPRPPCGSRRAPRPPRCGSRRAGRPGRRDGRRIRRRAGWPVAWCDRRVRARCARGWRRRARTHRGGGAPSGRPAGPPSCRGLDETEDGERAVRRARLPVRTGPARSRPAKLSVSPGASTTSLLSIDQPSSRSTITSTYGVGQVASGPRCTTVLE